MHCPILVLLIPCIFLLLPQEPLADLISDEKALLAFASLLPHGHKLNWSSTIPVCSWVGVTCTPDKNRVLTLRLPAVGLFGSIPPDTIRKLDALEVLSLRSNRLTEDLPPDVASLPSLRSLFLQHNNLSGIIPNVLSSNLRFLDLSYNSFVGEIPLEIQNLTQLTSLFLENNFLSGPIPELKLPKLLHLNLSNNNLSGPIPPSLRNFAVDSFFGNPFLCGLPLLIECSKLPPSASPTPSIPMNHKRNFWKRLSLGVKVAIIAGGSVLFLVMAMILIVLLICLHKRKHLEKDGGEVRSSASAAAAGGRTEKPKEEYSSAMQEAERNKLIFFEGCSYTFDLEDLLRASAEVLGKGSCGTTYKAVLEDGNAVVVKRLKEMVVGKRDFEQQMEVMRRVGHHLNVVPVRAYYYSKEEKLLVYDHVPNGSLSALLHGNKATGRTPLDWDLRVKILLGAAHGIAHIHAEGGGRFIHGNVKSSNILLSPDFDGRIAEYGITQLMSSPQPLAKMIGYRAPEVIETRKLTQKSDVYSFGVLLLEILTGKAPLRSPGREGSVEHLPRWVQSVVREEWTAEVFDVELIRHPNVEEEMVQMLQIAMQCVATHPDQRPKMEEVIKMIETIRNSDADYRQSWEETIKDENGQSS